MRCKVGDLVVVVRDHDFPQNLGAFGRVVAVADGEWAGLGDWVVQPSRPVWGWLNDEMTEASLSQEETAFEDDDLLPIRDNDGEDETLAWAGKPGHVIVQWRHKIPADQLPEWKL